MIFVILPNSEVRHSVYAHNDNFGVLPTVVDQQCGEDDHNSQHDHDQDS